MTKVHYEIFRQIGRVAGWSLVEAVEERNVAIERARQCIEEGRSAAVRVVKETLLSGTNDYVSLIIFEEGETAIKKKGKKVEDFDNPVPCFKPEDLYNYHARHTLSRLMGDWLARQRLTATEFLHSAKAVEIFEATGTSFQHAIQKLAVAQAADTNFPVAQIVKQLNELCTAAINRLYKDEKRGVFPDTQAGKFGPLAQTHEATPEGLYIVNGALTKYLAPATSWNAKLLLLLELMKELPPEGAARVLLLSCIDGIVAEILAGSAALADLLGQNPDLGHALLNLVELFTGTNVHLAQGGGSGLNNLAPFFAKDSLPQSKTAIAGRILAELRGLKRLCPSSLEQEFRMLRELANQLVRGQGKYLSHEDLIAAFTDRSRRLVAHEPLLQFMAVVKTPDEKVERLLTVEENIIGPENKRTLSTFIMPIITSHGFEHQLLADAPPLLRLQRLAALQDRVLRSGFQQAQKSQLAVAIDGIAQRIEDRAKLLATLEMRIANPVERAHAILKLCLAKAFTQGDLMMKARRCLLASLAKPGFLTSYVAQMSAQKKAAVDRDQVLAEFAGQLAGIGIPQEDTLRAVA